MLVYASALTRSSRASLAAKAQVFIGSDVRVSLVGQPAIPPSLARRATVVRRPETVMAGDQDVDLIAIDRRTFAQAAFWDSSFGSASLRSLLAKLGPSEPGQQAAAIVANGRSVHPASHVRDGPRSQRRCRSGWSARSGCFLRCGPYARW